jgi:hypothetical protein
MPQPDALRERQIVAVLPRHTCSGCRTPDESGASVVGNDVVLLHRRSDPSRERPLVRKAPPSEQPQGSFCTRGLGPALGDGVSSMLAHIPGLMYRFVLFAWRIFRTPPATISNLSLSPKRRDGSGPQFTVNAMLVSVSPRDRQRHGRSTVVHVARFVEAGPNALAPLLTPRTAKLHRRVGAAR